MLAMVLLAVALLQAGLLPRPLGVPPNVLLVGVVCWAALKGANQAAPAAFYSGLWLDLLSGRTLGNHALTLLLAVALAAAIVRAFDDENWLLPLSIVASGTLIFHLIPIITAGGAGNWAEFTIVILLPTLFWNTILALPEYMLLRWWSRRGQPQLEW